MSNTNVGHVYSQIINDVIEAVRVDFEESGVDEAVLGDLTKVSISRNHPLPVALPILCPSRNFSTLPFPTLR